MKRALALAVMALLPLSAGAQDAERGRQLAKQWCSGCHLVEGPPATARADGVPAFSSLSGRTVDQLRAAMNPQHGRMPDLALSKGQQDDLAAYIRSLPAN